MRHFSLFPILTLVLFCSAVFALTKEATQAPPQVDLGKTRQLALGWTQRKSFPDTITLAYQSVRAWQSLGEPLKGKTAETLVAFIKGCQRHDGGFVSDPKFGGQPNIIYTYYGLRTLGRLGALEQIDRERTARYVAVLAEDDGSIRPSPREKGRASLASTFYGVGALEVLGKLDLLDRHKTAAYVLGYRGGDDGFAMMRGGASSPQATAWAVRTLVSLGTLSDEVREGTIRYLEGAMGFLGTRGTRYRALATMRSAAGIADALAALDALDEVDTEKVVDFVESLYVPQNGGFGPSPGLGTTPPSTYQGLQTLSTLGRLGVSGGD